MCEFGPAFQISPILNEGLNLVLAKPLILTGKKIVIVEIVQ